MKTAVFCALGLLLLVFFAVWLIKRIRYRITPRHLKVVLFGVVLRRVRLSNIESVSKRRATGWAENWWSTLRPNHRMLVIRRRRGLFKNFIITPRNRYVFRTDLERAMKQASAPTTEENDDSEDMQHAVSD